MKLRHNYYREFGVYSESSSSKSSDSDSNSISEFSDPGSPKLLLSGHKSSGLKRKASKLHSIKTGVGQGTGGGATAKEGKVQKQGSLQS